ncbi:MAG TPA: Gfo/Idh/MocA family oxidoreductase [Aggregatilineaceae bacterium]|nr:Gfo/Idh/MocA family oxidoreductase [Aggregatilineaceae bacterium]
MTLRVGVLGAGSMGRTHTAGWVQTPAQLVGVYAADAAQMHRLADQYKLRAFASYDELLAAADVVDICTPTYLHHDHVLQAARAGKHIICEKPLALGVSQGQAMVSACEKAGVRLLVAQVVRFFPEYAAAKAVVDRGEIGRVAVIRLTRCNFQPKLGADNWFLDPARSGGMMLDLMIHDFDYARWVAGDVESVFARSIRSRSPEAPLDYALAILRHSSGAISNVEGGWAYPPPMFRTALEIAGDGGLIEHPAESSTPLGVYLKQSASGDSPEVGLPMSPMLKDPYTTEVKHFYDVLANGAVPRVTAQDGLAAVAIARAAVESARTGRPVAVGSVD